MIIIKRKTVRYKRPKGAATKLAPNRGAENRPIDSRFPESRALDCGAEAIRDFLWGDSMPRGNASKIRVLNQHLYGLGVSSRGRLITLIYRFVFLAPSASLARPDL